MCTCRKNLEVQRDGNEGRGCKKTNMKCIMCQCPMMNIFIMYGKHKLAIIFKGKRSTGSWCCEKVHTAFQYQDFSRV